MRLVLPGKPQAKSQALCTTKWRERRIIVYISSNALIILGGPNQIIQTIYHDRAIDLDGVTIDENTGKIAVCWASTVYVYRPYEQIEHQLRWSLQCSFDVESHSPLSQTLSWGSSEELLVGSDALRLYETIDEDHLIWNRQIASPAIVASFSHDASLIVLVAQYDRLAKVWRRRSYGSDDVRFDYSYLAHPTTVIGAQWRRPDKDDHHEKHVLYTVCADFKIRIWAAMDPHALQLLQPWAEIDMQASIQPRVEATRSDLDRYVFLIERVDFSQAISNTVLKSRKSSAKRDFIEHLLEIDVSKPDICVILDSRGHLSAWAVDYIGPKSKSYNDVHNIAHLEDFTALTTQTGFEDDQGLQMFIFAKNESSSQLCLLTHRHDGSIDWLEGEVTDFFDPSPNSERPRKQAQWTGHTRLIKRLVPSLCRESFMSCSSDSEAIVWVKHGESLVMQSHFISREKIVDSVLLNRLRFVVTLHEKGISLWDIRHSSARVVKRHALEQASYDWSLLPIERPQLGAPHDIQFFAIIRPPGTLTIWRVAENEDSEGGIEVKNIDTVSLHRHQSTRSLATEGISKLSIQHNEIVICSMSGHVHTLKLKYEDSVSYEDLFDKNWPSSSIFYTAVENPCMVAASRTKKMAIVDKIGTSLTIWDLFTGKLEYGAEYKANNITGLRWLATPTSLSILAVGFMHKIIVLAETRLDQSDGGRLLWVEVREIPMQDQTSQAIEDFVWFGAGNLVVASGNQLVVVDGKSSSSQAPSNHSPTLVPTDMSLDVLDTVEILNSSLPVYHPQHLLQMTLTGQAKLAQTVLIRLHNTLKFFSDGDIIPSVLGITTESFYQNSGVIVNGFKKEAQITSSDSDEDRFLTSDEAFELLEKLQDTDLSDISLSERQQLKRVVESMDFDRKSLQSLDKNAIRFLTLFKYFTMSRCKVSANAQTISWRELSWASHSQSQEILLDHVSRHFNGKLLWRSAREAGIFMWITDHAALRTQFEVVARNEYVKTDERNPIDCSLFYLALKKKSILQGLWRMASWNREQASTQKLLANDFSDPRWKTAALKNAYALLGKRRFGYAAAFFLLADNLRDAVNVCANQMHDLQLAIAISRIYEGNDNGDVLKDLLRNRVLPEAAATGNRWMASWAFWMLGSGLGKHARNDRRRAVEALMNDPEVASSPAEDRPLDSKSIHNIEPAQAVLYRHLRDQFPPSEVYSLQGKEWNFVLQMAKLYWRMGCGLLALNLLRNWKFIEAPKEESSTNESESERRSGSDNNGDESSVDEEEREKETETEVKAKQPPKPVFEEPSTSSLLDSFGY